MVAIGLKAISESKKAAEDPESAEMGSPVN